MNNLIAVQTREIRVFLSSTFRDMDAERTHLVKQVFPKVRAACLERQVGFSEIDLRWGVSEEESKNGATVEICLKEIERCRDFPPFFVGFLGERYGWVPKHDELSAYWDTHSDSQYAVAIRDSIKRGISVTELEMELAVLGVGAAEKIANHALFCLRDAGLTNALYLESKTAQSNRCEADFFDAGNGKLDALKQQIRKSGFLGLDNYSSVEQFGTSIENYLLAQLDRYFPADEVPTALQRGNAAHAGFRFHRLQNFLPRADVREQMIQAIEQRIEAPFLGPILVSGPSGQGKSALMADLARHYQTVFGTDWRVIDHYIGADSANHLDGWVDRILKMLHPDIQDIAGDMPESQKDKIEALSTWISMAARRNNCRYLLILDALDQLSDGGKNLDILTQQTLGPDGILIASAADSTPARTSSASWPTFIEVPPLTHELRTQLVKDTLARYRKTLPDGLAQKLATAPQSGSPLFLSLALEELRLDARHETLASITAEILKQSNAEQLFLNRFLLDAANARPEQPDLPVKFMALLCAARTGLSENELADLLAMSHDPIAEDTGKPRLPQVHLSRLLTNLAQFLLNKQGRRAPMHRILGKVALEYCGTASIRNHMYVHFAPSYKKGDNEYDACAASEALCQIIELAKLKHKGQMRSRKQLIIDLGYIPIPVNLHRNTINDGEKLVLDALNILNEDEQKQLQKLMSTMIMKLNTEGAENVLPSIRDFGGWLEYWAHYPLSLSVLQSLLRLQESLLDKNHEEIGNSSHYLGRLYTTMARFDDAMPLLQRALDIRENTVGYEHLDTATSLGTLADLLHAIGNKAEAELLYKRALVIREKVQGREHLDTATSINDLAGLIHDNGDYEGAEQLYRRALAITEKVLGYDNISTAISLNNLAGLIHDKGESVEAESLYRRALAITEKSLGPAHPSTATSLNNLAWLLANLKDDYEEAEPMYRRALVIDENFRGPDHPSTAKSLNNLAWLLVNLKLDLVEAKTLYMRALIICENTLGSVHPDVATCLDNLAGLLVKEGDFTSAKTLCRRALEIRENALGTNHPTTEISFINMSGLLEENGEIEEAIELGFKRYFQLQNSVDSECQNTLRTIQHLAVLLRNYKRYDEAEPLQRESVTRFTNIYGENGLETAAAYSGLGELLKLKGEFDEAAFYFHKALAIRERELGAETEPTKLVRNRLAELIALIKIGEN